MPIPTEKEILDFLEKSNFVNFSMIARHFEFNPQAVLDIISPLIKRKVVFIEKVGSNKFVRLRK